MSPDPSPAATVQLTPFSALSTEAAAGAPTGPSTGRARAATAIAVVAWALAVVSVCLMALARPRVDESLWFFVVDVTFACVYGTVGAVMLSRRAHPVPWLLGLAAIGGGLAAFGTAYDAWAWRPGGLDPNEAIAQLQSTGWVPGTLALFLVVPWLVRDHPLRWEWAGLLVGVALTIAMTLIQARNLWDWFDVMWAVIGFGLVTAAGVALRRWFGPPEERNGLGWLALGTAILAVSFLPLIWPQPWLPFWLTPVLHLVSQTVFPAAVLVAVLRNRMWGLQLVISRAVLVALLTTVLLALYLAVVVPLTLLLPGDGMAQLLAAAAVAVAVQPVRMLLARRVRRLVYGDAADPQRVASRLGSQLVSSESFEDLVATLAADLGDAMRLESVTVVADTTHPVRWGSASGPGTEVELRHRGELVGLLQVTARPGESLSARDLTTLRELSTVVAAAVVIGRGAAELEEVRGRLSAVRLEERRVIRREIHDGLGPSLAGISLGLQGARNLMGSDPQAGLELLAHLQAEIEVATASVRSLSHHLLPPVLDELGLAAALTELGRRYQSPALAFEVSTDGLDDLDTGLAAAAYGIASEAATNVLRHAGATRCRLEARRHGDQLVVRVVDDGRGLPDETSPGVGTLSMRERAEEQGGTLSVQDRPAGGTEVVATLPLVVRRG